jgi:hypothetical protein
MARSGWDLCDALAVRIGTGQWHSGSGDFRAATCSFENGGADETRPGTHT